MELAPKDKVILVTGGAAGIGQEIVKKLHALEAIPIVVDRVEKAEAKWGQDSSTIPELQWITVDLVEEDHCRKAVSQIIDQFGRIDGLVNNGIASIRGIPCPIRTSTCRNFMTIS
jgi:NAD(P)-dependent dehydrogenase (short-subunit alcohol dehydrogenase family)